MLARLWIVGLRGILDVEPSCDNDLSRVLSVDSNVPEAELSDGIVGDNESPFNDLVKFKRDTEARFGFVDGSTPRLSELPVELLAGRFLKMPSELFLFSLTCCRLASGSVATLAFDFPV